MFPVGFVWAADAVLAFEWPDPNLSLSLRFLITPHAASGRPDSFSAKVKD